jgi:hypothetical protein
MNIFSIWVSRLKRFEIIKTLILTFGLIPTSKVCILEKYYDKKLFRKLISLHRALYYYNIKVLGFKLNPFLSKKKNHKKCSNKSIHLTFTTIKL